MSKNHLCIFVKNPELGKVKTRLAKSINDKKALEVYKYLLQLTKKVVDQLNCDVTIWYANQPAKNDIWDDYRKSAQIEGDLGMRMHHAILESKKRSFENTCIIGSDCPGLTSEIINSAFDNLSASDVVIGPATDGGYYLIGMKKSHKTLFESINWSTSSVLSSTIEIANMLGLSYYLLPELSDIDTIDDLNRLLPNFYM
jgi:rSAM/selenodomain-associated transferase 1